MRLFMATLSTETNTFCTMPTAMSGFEDYFLRHGTATQEPPNLMTEALHVWRSRGEALGWEIIESLAAIAEPAGLTTAATYAALSGEILEDLARAGGADIVLLQLHGAMVAEGVEDCEGDIVARVRAACPEAVIGLALDLHCHLTEQMLEACDVIVTFKEYPHDDATPRAEELFELVRRTRQGDIRPVMAMYDCRMIQLYLTKEGAMRRFVDRLSACEAEPGILSVSLGHGFPWADVADVGARMLVVADGDVELAEKMAQALGRDFFDLRHEVTARYATIPQALDQAAALKGPVVLADMGDNSGGGAPGDATFLLRAMLERRLSHAASALIWDPVVVRICEDAGEGAELDLRLGGKIGPASSDPVDLRARVMRVRHGLGQHLGPGLEPLGTMVWLRTGDHFDIVLNNLRIQVYHPEVFEQMGIVLAEKHVVAVKSMFHFYSAFEPVASQIIQVATPGGTSQDFTAIPYTKLQAPYWPKTERPFDA